jgi:2,4-dienoyl-CoA reductase-like NADH-dependent reductase (Old Yellow Enzyme family)
MFDRGSIGSIEIKNRICRSATHENLAEEGGRVSPAMKEMYKSLSKGEVGLIITGFMSFSTSDNPSPKTILIGEDEAIPGLKELTDTVHENNTKIITQLAHVGSQLTHAPSGPVFAPSNITDPINGITPEPFSRGQLKTLVKEFGQAALRAKKAGFDGVQIHGAHGYLFSKFLSPVFNKRTDEYGGSPINNVRIILEVLREIKAVCGKDYPVWIKLNCSDFGKDGQGLDVDGFILTAKELEKNGIDAIEVSGGTMTGEHSPCRSKKHSAYHLPYATQLAREINVPIILVGGFRDMENIESALTQPGIEAVSMSRPLIREPGLVKRWMEGDRKKAACVACNGCFNPNGALCFFSLEGEEREAQKQVMKMMAALGGDK